MKSKRGRKCDIEFVLFLDLNNIDYYGYIPEIPKDSTGRVEIFPLQNQWDDVELFMDDLSEINERCDALLDYGDVDYFDSKKCVKLREWIVERLNKPIVEKYNELLEILKKFVTEQSNLKRGW